MAIITLITQIKAPIQQCFDLSRSIDLHKISTAHTREQAVDGITSGLIGLGESVTWRAKHFGVWQHLTSLISKYDYPIYFQDTMVKGAFKKMCHDHYFEINGDYTIMTDRLIFNAPWGILGIISEQLFLKKYLTTLLQKRNQTIKHFAESNQWKSILTT